MRQMISTSISDWTKNIYHARISPPRSLGNWTQRQPKVITVNVATQIIDLIQEHHPSLEDLSKKTALIEDVGLSSIEVMELIEVIEDHFDVAFPLNNLENITTLDDLANVVKELLRVNE